MKALLFVLLPTYLLSRDPVIQAAPEWEIRHNVAHEKLLGRVELGMPTGAITLAGDKLLIGASYYGRTATLPGLKPTHDCALMICLDLETSELLWSAEHPRNPLRRVDMGLPLETKPCIEGDRAWYYSNVGELVCIDLEGLRDGQNDGPFTQETTTGPTAADYLWKLDLVSQLGVFKRGAGDIGSPSPSPILFGDLIFCVTGEGSRAEYSAGVAAGEAPSFIAVHKATGEVAWSSSVPSKDILYCQWSSPVIVQVSGQDQVIFPGGDGFLYAFLPETGALLWKLDCNEPGALPWKYGIKPKKWEEGKMRNAFLAPPVVDQGVIYVGLGDCIEQAAKNAPLLAIEPGHQSKPPRILWQFQNPLFRSTLGPPAIHRGIIYLHSYHGTLFALDQTTGKELWHSETEGGNSTFYGGPVVVDERVIVGGDEGELTLFAIGKNKRCLGSYMLPGSIHNEPAFRDGVIYQPIGNTVLKLQLPKN